MTLFNRGAPHPEAQSMLDLLSTAGLLETQSQGDIIRIYERDGFRPAENPGSMSLGWGGAVERPGVPTTALLLSSDQKVLHVGHDPKNRYYVSVLVEDVARPTAEELAEARLAVAVLAAPGFAAIGPRLLVWLERNQIALPNE